MPCFTQSSSTGFCGTWEKSVAQLDLPSFEVFFTQLQNKL
jgi:hypothetical protein